MWWECSECGCRVRRQSSPQICPECGIASYVFAQADTDNDWEPGSGTLRDFWLEVGMSTLRGPTRSRQRRAHWLDWAGGGGGFHD